MPILRPLLLCGAVACAPPGAVRTAPMAPASGLPTGGTPTGPGGSGSPAGSPVGPGTQANGCPPQMARIEDPALGAFCIDRYEAGLAGWSPFEVPVGAQVATVAPGAIPQGYLSGDQAAQACAAAGKRLCGLEEWLRACQGPQPTTYPYGDTYDPTACNTERDSHPVLDLFGSAADWSAEQMNDPGLNQLPDTVDPAGSNPGCVSAEGVYDLHGNLHEWIDDPTGVFKGGFYADAAINGPGCLYTTTAHDTAYHDYSTGFRCCAEPSG